LKERAQIQDLGPFLSANQPESITRGNDGRSPERIPDGFHPGPPGCRV